MPRPVAKRCWVIVQDKAVSFISYSLFEGTPDSPGLLQALPGEHRHEWVQGDSAPSLAHTLEKRKLKQALKRAGEPAHPVRVLECNGSAKLQQGARDWQARC